MKKLSLFLISLFLTIGFVNAKSVDSDTAKEIGKKFLKVSAKMDIADNEDLQLVKFYSTNDGDAAFYVFNTENGFVIVSAVDYAIPILGYSDEGQFRLDNIPVQMEEYLQGFVEQIQYGKDNNLVADDETVRQWELVRTTGRINNKKSTDAVAPLLSTTWNQNALYNNLCPSDAGGPNGHVYAGCVATAMGQIMKYWSYPTTGTGSHTYTPDGYPQQTANYGATTYNWSNMPNALSAGSPSGQVNAIATLLWHCGVAVNMMYGPNGSGAYDVDVPPALTNYFNYANEMISANKNNYTNASWFALLKPYLDAGQPIYYSGNNANYNGGHAFVCDGYNSSDQLHFNWGWSGSYNNYFSLGALNPGGYDFNYINHAILNIRPTINPSDTYQISATASPTNGGTVAGGGTYAKYQTCTLTATPAAGFDFFGWKEGNTIVSTDLSYSFIVRQNRTLVAEFSLPTIASVSANYYPDPENPASPYVEITWGGDTPPTPGEGQWYYYGDENLSTNIGASGPFWWAVMFPAGSYTGDMVTKVATYATGLEAFTGSVTIYNDGTSAPATPVGSMNISVPAVAGMYELEFPTPIDIDNTKNLWVVMYNESSSDYIAGACADAGDTNARWVSLDGSSWFDLADAGVVGYSWILQAYIAQGSAPTPPSGNATIILTAGDIWGDGSGYQMLLDNTHSLYGTTIPTTGALSTNCSGNDDIYSQFSHKIPTNADGNCTTSNIVYNNSIALTIPAGTYDWCITNPTPGDRIWIASGNGNVGGRYNDYVFQGGNTYEFTVSMFGSNDGVDVTITGGAKNTQRSMSSNIDCKIADGITASNRGITDNPQIQYYKVYRTECSNNGPYTPSNTTTLATQETGTSFIDDTWASVGFGSYKFGVSYVTVNGTESDIIWSNCLEKGIGYTITATADPATGGNITGAGLYEEGTTCTLTATPSANYTFVNWTMNGTVVSTNTSISFTVTENASYVAHFNMITHNITASANPAEGGNVTGAGTYSQGSSCTLTATANTGYDFTNWTKDGTVVSSNASYTFTVTETANYVANFTLRTYSIAVVANPAAGGTVDGAGTYNHGATATLIATASPNYTFIEWRRGLTIMSEDATYSFTVTESGTYTAIFALNNYEVSVSTDPTGCGIVTGGGSYSHGTTVSVGVTPYPNYTFDYWTMNGVTVSEEPQYSFVITENCQLVAHLTNHEGIDENDATILSVYPNPSHDKITLKGAAMQTVMVYNAMGQLVIANDYDNVDNVDLDLSGLVPGIYTVTVRMTDDTIVNKQVVKE